MTTATETKSGANQNGSQSGEKLHALIADMDFSDVPEGIREAVITKMTEKAKLYDSSYRAKTEMLSEEKKRVEVDRQSIKALLDIQRELKDNPNMEKAVIKVINDFRSGKTVNSEVNRDTNIKRLDKLIDNASDPDTREQLREMRQIVIEETDAPAVKGKLAELEEEIKRLKSSSFSNHAEKVDAQIDSLEKEYGKEFVSKYREDIRDSAIKYPKETPEGLLHHYALKNGDKESLQDAVLKSAEAKKKKEIEFKKTGSLPDGRSISTKVDIPKDSHGRVHWGGFIKNMKAAGRFG